MEAEMTVCEYSEFASILEDQLAANTVVADECKNHLRLSLSWTAMHLESAQHEHCKLLLQGSYGTAVEAVSLLSVGLVRPAVLSLRAHYELSLQYLFYKDHPVEWNNVKSFHKQPNLPAVNKKYLTDFYPDFDMRMRKLSKNKTRENEDCYAVISGIAHGTAIYSITTAIQPRELVESKEVVASAMSVFLDVAETVSDINVACFESNWFSIPNLVQEHLASRFGGKQAASELSM